MTLRRFRDGRDDSPFVEEPLVKETGFGEIRGFRGGGLSGLPLFFYVAIDFFYGRSK